MASENYELHLLVLDYARRCAGRLGAGFDVVDISGIGRLLGGSALTGDIDVPHGHYAADNMSITVVPNCNAIMLSMAYGVAVARTQETITSTPTAAPSS